MCESIPAARSASESKREQHVFGAPAWVTHIKHSVTSDYQQQQQKKQVLQIARKCRQEREGVYVNFSGNNESNLLPDVPQKENNSLRE